MTRWLLTSLAWLVATAVLLPICFFAVIVLAGPHGGMLPRVLESPVFVACWLVLLVVPVLAARAVWRRRG
jgi:uncharacterized membrane protein